MPSLCPQKSITLIVLIALLMPVMGQAASLSPGLQKAVSQSSMGGVSDSLVEVVIFLDDFDVRSKTFSSIQTAKLNRSGRIKTIITQLKSYQHPEKQAVLNYISAHTSSEVVEHWIVPAFKATLPLSKVESLSEMRGVKLVVENARLSYESPVDASPALSTVATSVSDQLNLLNVPELWARGLKGKGRLVCSFDTGVEGTHPALASSWRGNHASLTSSWFSKIAPTSLPYDSIGHGTHTMGIMVGAAEADTFGVAPEAEWITAGIIDQGRTLSLTISDIIEAFQWTLNPDGDVNTTDDVPDVILNSWGFPKGLFTPCDDTFWGIIDYVEAAGIVTIFSAGNEGPDPMTLRSPADRASSPINAFAVGAVDNVKNIAYFSSRGPSSCDTTQIKPEVVAPGIDIRSSYKGGGYYLMSGTSMAAPYIAGMVALIRQYNPEATVEQIKNAFILAAHDLGPDGEDNAYGHGFVDAGRVLDFIDEPDTDQLFIARYEISGDGIAFPGETFGLTVTLNQAANTRGDIYGIMRLVSGEGVVIDDATALFSYDAVTGSTYNSDPFIITYDSALYNGQMLQFELALSSLGEPEVLDLNLAVGLPPKGEIASHANGQLQFTVSDFGQFGFAPGSIYNALGDGFRYNGSGNLLYEAGLIVTADETRMATAVRDELGNLRPSDFAPVRSLSDESTGADGGLYRSAVLTDATGEVPVTIEQRTICYDDLDNRGFAIIKYTLTNTSMERISDLCLAFLADFDLSDADAISIDDASGIVYQSNGYDLFVGAVSLTNIGSFQTIANGTAKSGLSDDEMKLMVTSSLSSTGSDALDDWMFMICSKPMLIDPRQSTNAAMAIVTGRNIAELYENANRARTRYEVIESFAQQDAERPDDPIRLYQNYPNPFNPVTNISFSVLEAGEVSLDVINILGQKVRTLYSGYLSTGHHKFEWDATDEGGSRVSSGVYFYRLRGESSTQSRKMLLMK